MLSSLSDYQTLLSLMVVKISWKDFCWNSMQRWWWTQTVTLHHKTSFGTLSLKCQARSKTRSYLTVLITLSIWLTYLHLRILWRTRLETDRQGTAQTTIQWLHQRNQDFSTYLAEFNRHVRYTQWNEEAKKSALLAGISDELRQLLITVNTTGLNLESLTRTLQSIDNCHWAAQQVTRNNTHSWVTTSQSHTFAAITASVVPQSVHSSTFITAQRATAPAVSEDLMDLSVLQSQRQGSLSAAEKAHCMQNNLCLYCEEESHKAVICTVKPSLQMQLRQIFFSTQQSEIVKEQKTNNPCAQSRSGITWNWSLTFCLVFTNLTGWKKWAHWRVLFN